MALLEVEVELALLEDGGVVVDVVDEDVELERALERRVSLVGGLDRCLTPT